MSQVDRFYLVPFSLTIDPRVEYVARVEQRTDGALDYVLMWIEDKATGAALADKVPAAMQVPDDGPMVVPLFL